MDGLKDVLCIGYRDPARYVGSCGREDRSCLQSLLLQFLLNHATFEEEGWHHLGFIAGLHILPDSAWEKQYKETKTRAVDQCTQRDHFNSVLILKAGTHRQ